MVVHSQFNVIAIGYSNGQIEIIQEIGNQQFLIDQDKHFGEIITLIVLSSHSIVAAYDSG